MKPVPLLALLPAVAALASFSVSNQEHVGSFPSLDQALIETAALDQVELQLLPSPQPFSISAPVVLFQHLYVRGEGQSIELIDAFYVAESGLLSVSNVSLLLSETFSPARVCDVRGTLILENSFVRGLMVPLIWLYGSGKLFEVNISDIRATAILVKSGKAALNLTSVAVSRISAGLVASDYVEFLQTRSTITIADTQLEGHSGEAIFFFFYGGSADIHVVSSDFTHSGLVYQSALSNQKMVLRNCVFRDSTSTILDLSWMTEAEIRIINCSFINNFDESIFVHEFSGLLEIADSLVTRQRGSGVLYAYNGYGKKSTCRVDIQNMHISDINTTVDRFERATVITTSDCSISISNLTIRNVTLAVLPSVTSFTYVFFARFSDMHLANVTVEDSAVDLCMLNAEYSIVYQTGFFVDNLRVGVALYFLGGSQVYLRNADIRRIIAGVFIDEYTILGLKCMYFVSFFSDFEVRNASVSATVNQMGPLFSFIFSNYSVSNINLSHMPIQSVLLSSLSSGYISDINIDTVIGDLQIFYASHSITAISNVTFTNSQLIAKSGVLLFASTNATLSNFNFVNSTMEALISCSKSRIVGINLTLARCVVTWLTCNVVNSVANIENLKLLQSVIRRLAMTSSSLAISHSEFTALYSKDVLFDVASSNVSFIDLRATNISTVSKLARLTQGSRLATEKSEFNELRVHQELGWQISESTLNVTFSRFSNFNFSLFQAELSNISFFSSMFVKGNNPLQFLKSTAAFGGVLSCVNCPLITIERTRFLNISAKVGGAVAALRSSYNTEKLYLAVRESEFIGCKAQQAGALFLQNTSFTIDNSLFMLNLAEQRGGGIFAAIKPWQNGIIRNSRFDKNSAFEGGAVKWSNAPVLLANVSFEENSATYGADVASYGVSLSSSLTQLIGNESSGYSLRVIFELLDHYGHRVSLSSFQVLILLSTPTVTYRGNNATFLNLGLFNFSELTIYAPPASTQVIQACLNDSQEDFDLNMAGLVPLQFRSCLPGEIQRLDRCDYCYPGYYSFSPSDSNCSFCVKNAFCPGGSTLEVNPGYWRSSWNSSVIISCPFPSKCLGGNNSTCYPGFTGMLCNQCTPNTTRVRAVECKECILELVVLRLCMPFIVLLFLRWGVLKLCTNQANLNRLFVAKVVLRHVQYLSTLCFLRISYSDGITWSLHEVNWISSLLITDLPLSCLGISNPEYAKALIGSFILPALLLLLLLIHLLRHTKARLTTIPVLVSCLLYFMPYITLITSIPLLVCQEVNSASALFFFDMSETCWQGLHLKYVRALVLPSLLLNVGGPVMAVFVFRIFHPNLFNHSFPLWTAGLEFKLYSLFEKSLEYFFLCAVILSTTIAPLLQVTYSLISLIVISTVHVTLHKWIFTSEKHFLLSEASILTVALSVGFLSYYVFYLPGEGGIEYFVNAMVWLLNVAFLGLCIWSFRSNWLEAGREEEGASMPPPPNTPNDSLTVMRLEGTVGTTVT